jgi:hypothetical protein
MAVKIGLAGAVARRNFQRHSNLPRCADPLAADVTYGIMADEGLTFLLVRDEPLDAARSLTDLHVLL